MFDFGFWRTKDEEDGRSLVAVDPSLTPFSLTHAIQGQHGPMNMIQ